MTDKVIIGILGKSGSGKDAFCKAVIKAFSSEYNIERIALADALKEEVVKLDPYDLCLRHGVNYDYSAPLDDPMCPGPWGKQRDLLQYWGQYKRKGNLFYWVKKLDDKIKQSSASVIIVPDIRYKNEVYYVKSGNGFTVRMVRQNHVGLVGEAANHISETELNDYKPDYTLEVEQNNIEALNEGARDIFEQIASSLTLQEFESEELYA